VDHPKEILRFNERGNQLKQFKLVAMISCFVFLALAIMPRAKADEYDKKTTMTFTEPFEVPGVDAQILPAGTYIFKLLDSSTDRDIVQIFSADGLHIYTTILAIPNYRLKVTDKTVLTFGERGARANRKRSKPGFIRDNPGARNLFTRKSARWSWPRS
jgi:hypothetical protein